MKKILFFLFLVLPGPGIVSCFSQEGKLFEFKGVVLDSVSGRPLEGATVFLSELERGTVTDSRGQFSLEGLKKGKYSVTVRFLGYHSYSDEFEVGLAGKNVFRLCPESFHFHEFLVVAERKELKSPLPIARLERAEVERLRGQTMGEMLAGITGVNLLTTGPAVAKPVIRGLHSQRLLTLNNGIRQEGQQWGAEHGPEIDPFSVAEAEVIKGAGTIEFGPEALAGVVRVKPGEMPPHARVGGELMLNGFSNNSQGGASLMLEGRTDKVPLGWRVQGSLRRAGDSRAPEYVISNTAFSEKNWSAAASYSGKKHKTEFSYSNVHSDLGIFIGSHLGNITDLRRAINSKVPLVVNEWTYKIDRPRQEVSHGILSLKSSIPLAENKVLEVQLGRQQNQRLEFDRPNPLFPQTGAEPDFDLTLTTYTVDAKLNHELFKNVKGKVGINATRQGNVSEGNLFLIPNFRSHTAGVFLVEKWKRGRWFAEAGSRVDIRDLKAYFVSGSQVMTEHLPYRFFAASLGSGYEVARNLQVSANLSSSARPPSANELFSNGLHGGTASYEIGDKNLKQENSLLVDLNGKYSGEKLTVEISGYHNRMSDFIFLQPDGTNTITIRGTFPSFRYIQNDVSISGVEFTGTWNPSSRLGLSASGSLLRAQNRDLDVPLIFMPSNRGQLSLNYRFKARGRFERSYTELNGVFVSRQNRVPEGIDLASPPDGFLLLNFNCGTSLKLGKQTVNIHFSIKNCLNSSYREYTSRFRYFTDEPGRNFVLRVGLPFNLKNHQN